MPVSCSVTVALRKALTLGLVGLLATAGFAQEAAKPASPPTPVSGALVPMPQAPKPQGDAYKLYSDQNYTRGQSQFPNFWSVWGVRQVPQANFTNTPLIDQVIRDGKMYLSLSDAVALALENNLDIAIQRYNLITADVDILRTSSGAASLGVNTGLVQGTPGGAGSTATSGTSGGGAGGTSIGIAGAGAGAAGIVTSTQGEGAPIDNFDPVLDGTIQGQRATTPQPNTIFTGTPTLNAEHRTLQLRLHPGVLYRHPHDGGLSTTAGSPPIRYSTLSNPYVTRQFSFQLRQHVLQGFGFNSNQRWIKIARNNRAIMDAAYQNQIMTTVSQIQNIYWDLVNAYENVKVQQRALDLADKTLSDNEKQVEIGTLAPITVVQAKSSVATAKQNLIISQTNLQLQQLLMKNAITRNNTGPILANAPVIPTDTLQINEPFEVPPVEQLIETGVGAPPGDHSIAHQFDQPPGRSEGDQEPAVADPRRVSRSTARQAWRATRILQHLRQSGSASEQLPASRHIPNTGYGHAFGNLFNSTAPDKGIGVNINIPLRNRQNQADQVRSVIEYRQAQMSAQQQENTITLQVRNAQFALTQNYAALQSAVAARDYARENLDAEQKKYSLGASTSTLVLQASSALTQAESNVLAAATNYEKSRVQLDLYTADTLTKLGISMADAQSGKVTKMPTVPGIVPGTPPGTSAPPATQPEAPPKQQ